MLTWYLGSEFFTGQRREMPKINLSASQDLPGAVHSSHLQTGFSYSFDLPVPFAYSWISHIGSKDRPKEQQVNRQTYDIAWDEPCLKPCCDFRIQL